MTNLKTNILEVIGSSREPLSVPEILQDVQNWPIATGGKRRTEVTTAQVQAAVDQLQKERAILPVGEDGWIVRRSQPVEEKQLQLF